MATNSLRAKQRGKNTIRFNKESLGALPIPSKRTYYYDEKVPQLGITHLPPSKQFPEGKKTFFARVTWEGATDRITIENGTYPGMAIDVARTKAGELVGKVAKGIHPREQKRAQKAAKVVTGLTVEDAIDLFAKNKVRRLSTGEKLPLKESTTASYRKTIKALLGEDLYKGAMVDLTEDAITKQVHLGEKTAKTSAATGCRSLSAVWNWLAKQKEYRGKLPPNPVKQYALYNEGLHVAAPKQTRIEREELEGWFTAVEKLQPIYRDFFLWLIFTGNRFGEAKALDWSDIDWRRKVYQLRDPKNRRDVTLPLPSYVATRLEPRKEDAGAVFPFEGDARKEREKACNAMGKKWTNHDLRRTFSGVAQAVCNYTSVKRLMNHAFTDITEIYIGHSADLGEEIDKVQREILRLAGRPVDNVVKLVEVAG